MKIFLSYSHRDKKDLEDIQAHLRPLTRGAGALQAWSDLDIKIGQDWRDQITSSVQQCDIAVLLVSAYFLASDFIVEEELKPLFDRYKTGNIQIICVPLTHCSFSRDANLSKIQSIPAPDNPIRKLSRAKRDEAYEQVRRRIEELAGVGVASAQVSSPRNEQKSPDTATVEKRTYSNEKVKITDLYILSHLDDNGYLDSYHFDSCHIVGPALVSFVNTEIRDAKFRGKTLDISCFIVKKNKPSTVGTIYGCILFKNSKFLNCTFDDICFYEYSTSGTFIEGLLASSNLIVVQE